MGTRDSHTVQSFEQHLCKLFDWTVEQNSTSGGIWGKYYVNTQTFTDINILLVLRFLRPNVKREGGSMVVAINLSDASAYYAYSDECC